MPVAIQIGLIKVGALQNDSGVFFGQNMQNGWDSHTKRNAAGPESSGDYNYLPSYYNIVWDPDFIDAPIFDQDIKSPSFSYVMGI